MLHEDHLGNRGNLHNGGVQWMTAGRGIIHSEMPQQEEGVMRGFQLWLNLPAAEKMTEAGYRDIQPEEIPEITFDGGTVKLIAGAMVVGGQSHRGAMPDRSTQPVYADIHLASGASVTLPVPETHNGMLYLYEGDARLSDADLQRSAANILGDGDGVRLQAGNAGARLLLIAGKPIGEPVVQYGPFVMNTREEIERALRDYRDGRLTT